MSKLPVLCAALLACAFLSPASTNATTSTANGRSYVVDPDGTEDFSDLQTALDTVPAGSRLLVKGVWTDYRTWIRKSVTLLGLHLVTSPWYDDYDKDDAILEIDAGADADVTLCELDISLGIAWDAEGTRAIHVKSARNVVLAESSIQCNSVVNDYCESYTRNGDGLVVDSAQSVAILSSSITGGGPGWPLVFDCLCFVSNLQGPRGGHAVLVQGSVGVIVVEDSALTGGGGGDVNYDCWACGGQGDPPPFVGGDGGSALAGGPAHVSNSLLVGGAPGHVHIYGCDSDYDQPGQPGSGGGNDLPQALTAGAAVLGQTLTIDGSGYAADHAVLLFLSNSFGPPVTIRQGPWFLSWPFYFVGASATDDAGSFSLSGTLPDDLALEGVTFVLQATDVVATMSEPLIFIPFRAK